MLSRAFSGGQTGPSVAGIGVDVVEVDRVRACLRRFGDAFVTRVFARSERVDPGAPHAAAHYAARFAAKEAFRRALAPATGIQRTDVTIHRRPSGAPSVGCRGRAAELLAERGVTHVHVSLTHEREAAAALVILERRR